MTQFTINGRSNSLGIALIVVLLLSSAIQLFLWPHIDNAGGPMATPDTPGYVNVANALTGTETLATIFRTPSYPAMLFLLTEETIPQIRSSTYGSTWAETYPKSLAWARRIQAFQYVLGTLTAVLIFAAVQLGFQRYLLSSMCVALYFLDLPTLSYQDVILTETLSVFTTWLALCFGVILIRWPGKISALLAGSAATLAIGVRPPLAAVAGSLMLISIIPYFLQIRQHGLRTLQLGKPKWAIVVIFVLSSVSLPFAWATMNHHWHGFFRYTAGASKTIPNHLNNAYINLEMDDPRHLVLQRHIREAIADGPDHAHSRVAGNVRKELNLTRMQYHTLLTEMIVVTITRSPLAYAKSVAREFVRAWAYPFSWPHATEMRDRVAKLPVLGTIATTHGYLPGTILAFPLFLIAIGSALRFTPDPKRRMNLAYMAGFALLYTLGSAATDSCSTLRHVLAARVVIGVVILAGFTLSLEVVIGRNRGHRSRDTID